MSRKNLILTLIGVLTLSAALIPLQVRAGGVCGGAYIVETGDTVDKLASMCGTSAAAIYAANPGLKGPLVAGQSVVIPGANFGVTPPPTATAAPTASAVAPTTPAAVVNNYYTYNTYNYYSAGPGMVVNGTYVVQPGDTFAGIAYSYGISVNDLWAANPGITDINVLYVGQALSVPLWSAPAPKIVSIAEVPDLKYSGTIPHNASEGIVRLVNKTDGNAYISFRITRADGTNGIYEYPVKRSANVNIPTGWIDYVAWVGGVKFTGGFQLGEDTMHTVTFNKSKVVVD